MGRNRWTGRLTVERCRAFDVAWIRRSGVFDPSKVTIGTISWPNPFGGTEAAFGFCVGRTRKWGWTVLTDPKRLERTGVP